MHFTELGKPLLQNSWLSIGSSLPTTKVICYPSIGTILQYPIILKLLITRGNITLIPKETTQEKEKEILKSQPEKLNKKENEKEKI